MSASNTACSVDESNELARVMIKNYRSRVNLGL